MTKYKININKTNNALSIEHLALTIAILEPLSTVPQILDIYRTQDVESLSLLSWLLFAAASIVWLVYGIKINNLPLIASSMLWVTTEVILIFGILIYS
jgi:MtN3 and saliva related transmembrane protein